MTAICETTASISRMPNGTNELTVGNGLIDKIPHTGVHHEASDSNIEYWQCSMCGKYFTDEACTHEVTADEVLKTVFGTLTVGTNGASGYYTLESKTYTLTEDVNTAGYIYVPEDVTATINLAGYTIDRGLTSAITNGMVIWVAGSLTVTDSGTGGTIKGGMDSSTEHVSCVLVYSDNGGSAFTLQGGTLIGNTSNQYNSAVLAPSNSNITISGGKITGDVYGIRSNGNVTVSGGEISGNSTGIYSQNNSVSVSGNPVITNNTNENVMLYYSDASVLTIAGELTAGANIGITKGGGSIPTDNAPVTITSGYGTYNSNVSPGTYFSLDNNGQIQTGPSEYMTLVMGWNQDRTEIAVGTAMRTVTFDLQGHGSAIESVSLLSGYKLIEPTEPTAEGWSFAGWFTDLECTDANEWNFDSGVTSDMTLYALWTQGQTYRVTLPENMIIVNADNEAVGGKYPSGTNIRFKVAPDYKVDGDVKNGTETLTADGDGIYSVTVGNADITITATTKKAAEPNKTLSGSESYTAQNGDVLTGSTSGTVTIPDGASITLSDVSISGGIVCNGSVTITLVGTNSVTGASQKAGIEVGGSGTTLTIKGNGSLTATGGQHSAGIGLSRAWNPDNDVIGGNIVIEGGTITANGGSQWGAGIGTGVIYGNGSAKTARLGNITIKGGTVKATSGSDSDGIGTGYTYSPCTNAIGTVTIYDEIDLVNASSIKNFASVVYMHGETNVTASKTDYFTIGEDGNRRLIVQKPVIADIPDQTYTGSAITPEPKVTIGSLILTKGTDYEYSYTDNTNVGTNAKVTITFKGDYASLGTAEKTFTINPAVVFNANGHGTAPDTQPLSIGDKVSRPDDLTAYDNGITTYTVDDTREGQQAVRRIIDTHWGKDANPWCLAARQDGRLTNKAWKLWSETYNATDKRIAFKNGKLLACCASGTGQTQWWDREDNPHNGIPYTIKNKGTTTEYSMIEETGKLLKTGETLPDGGEHRWFENGQLETKILPDGSSFYWHKNRKMSMAILSAELSGTSQEKGYQWMMDGRLYSIRLQDDTVKRKFYTVLLDTTRCPHWFISSTMLMT